MRVNCPHCGGRTRAVSSHLVTDTTRRADVVCLNPDCGWTGTAMLMITGTKSPGLLAPKPSRALPGQLSFAEM